MTARRTAAAVDARHGGIACGVRGEGPIGVLLVHPALADGSMFDPLVAQRVYRYRRVAVDLAGHGARCPSGSDASADPSPLPTLADVGPRRREILDRKGIEQAQRVGASLADPRRRGQQLRA